MKTFIAAMGAVITVIGAIIALIGFFFFPFAMDPLTLRMSMSSDLMLRNAKRIANFSCSLYSGGVCPDEVTNQYNALLFSANSLWAIPLLTEILIGLACIWFGITLLRFLIWRKNPEPFTPVIVLLVIIATGICLFTTFYEYTISGANLFSLMFREADGPFGPIIGPGWWLCTGGIVLALIGNTVGLVASRSDPKNNLRSYPIQARS